MMLNNSATTKRYLGPLFIASAFVLLLVNQAAAESVRVASASNFSAPLKELVERFHQSSAHRAKVSYASSGKLYAQIINGAPFDVFLSADQDKPKALVRKGYVRAEDVKSYAVGRLVLWSTSKLGDPPLARLQNGEFSRLSLANPKFAPYGIAAQDVLQRFQLLESTKKKWILGENIAQTFQFVSTGHAQLGFVAASQVKFMDSDACCFWQVPQELHEPIVQDAAILSRAKENSAASAFFDLLSSNEAIEIFRRHGYQMPKKTGSTYNQSEPL